MRLVNSLEDSYKKEVTEVEDSLDKAVKDAAMELQMMIVHLQIFIWYLVII